MKLLIKFKLLYSILFISLLFSCHQRDIKIGNLLYYLIEQSLAEADSKKDSDDKEEPNQIAETAPIQLKTTQFPDSNNVLLSWKKVKDKNGKEISSYEVSMNNWSSSSETKESFYMFKNLRKSKKFNLKVRPKGSKDLVAEIAVTTGDNPPTKPRNLKFDQTVDNFIVLSWDKATDEDNDPISYEVSKNGIEWIDVGSKTTWTFKKLLPKTTYQLQVRGTTSKSDGASASISVAIQQRFAITASFVNFEEISLKWFPVKNAKDYEAWISSNSKWQSTSGKTTWTFKKLPINQEFTIKVRVKDDKGEIIAEETVTEKTDIWSQLSLAWKTLIAENVGSIKKDPLPQDLTTAQINDIINLKEINYNCGQQHLKAPPTRIRCAGFWYNDSDNFKIKDLSPVKYFKSLVKLNIRGNQIKNITPENISNLTHLQSLDLVWNYIEKLPPEISKLNNLEELYLSFPDDSMYLNLVVPDEFRSLTNLKTLHFVNQSYRDMPPQISSLINLETLYLQNVNENYSSLVHLTKLKVLEIPKGEINSDITSLRSLEKLVLKDSYKPIIPAEIGNLTKLKYLDLSDHNGIPNIPAEIGNLTELEYLDLSIDPTNSYATKITSIPTTISSLTKLQTLDLSNHSLTILPTAIGSLTNLQTMDLSNNKITSLPTTIGSLTNLQTMDLSNNKITSLPTQIGSLTNLQTMDLSNNKITSLPVEINSLSELQKLSLFKNQINSILPNTFTSLDKLTLLSLYDQKQTDGNQYIWTKVQRENIQAQIIKDAQLILDTAIGKGFKGTREP